MIRPTPNRSGSTVALAFAGFAAIFACLSFVVEPGIAVLPERGSASVHHGISEDASTASVRERNPIGTRNRIGIPIPVERTPAPPTRNWTLKDIDDSGDSRARIAAEVAGQDISKLPAVAEKLRDARELDQVVVAAVSYAAKRNAPATLAAARGLMKSERTHAQALVGHEYIRRRDLLSAINVMKSLEPDIARTMLIWTISARYASQDITGAGRWVMDAFPKNSADREDAFGAIVAARFGSLYAADLRHIMQHIENKTDRTIAVDAVARALAATGQAEALDVFAKSLLPQEAEHARKIYSKTSARIHRP